MSAYGSTALIEHHKLSAIVESYQRAQEDVRQAFQLFQDAKARLLAVGLDEHLFEGRISDYSLDHSAEESRKYIQQKAWRSILGQLQIESFLSAKRMEELEKQIKENSLPEITVENVLATLDSVRKNLPNLVEEHVREIFNWLRPSPQLNRHKTNQLFSVGEKVIISYAVGEFGLNYYKEQNIRSLDTVLHLLDGKGAPKYPDDLVTQLNQAIREHCAEYENDYFACKWFRRAGTLHIRFKRLDLLKELNRQGGGQGLRDKEHAEKKREAREAVL